MRPRLSGSARGRMWLRCRSRLGVPGVSGVAYGAGHWRAACNTRSTVRVQPSSSMRWIMAWLGRTTISRACKGGTEQRQGAQKAQGGEEGGGAKVTEELGGASGGIGEAYLSPVDAMCRRLWVTGHTQAQGQGQRLERLRAAHHPLCRQRGRRPAPPN